MTEYQKMSPAELNREYASVLSAYESLKAEGLNLNLTRGKPEKSQLDLSDGMLDTLKEGFTADGMDVRNYGCLEGLPCCRKLFAELLGCKPEEVIIGGNASLNLMYDLIAKAYTHGLKTSVRPWSQEAKLRWLCPVPGYDRHFNVTLSFGMELINIPMTENGPDMDLVEKYALDPTVKGIWCVPKYSNPDGIVYSEETCRRLASMKTGAPDFTIMWDNAYGFHAFDGPLADLPDMLTLCREAGNPDRVFEFASTSKVTYAGAGVSCMAANVDNLKYILSLLTFQTIGYNKIDQLMHVRFLKDRAGTLAHMEKHAAIMQPKFAAVLEALETEVRPTGTARWHSPKGGYFISLFVLPGTAKRTYTLCKEAGVSLTPAGATYPRGIDPDDSNMRIAPSYPPMAELKKAVEVLCISVRLAALEKLMNK